MTSHRRPDPSRRFAPAPGSRLRAWTVRIATTIVAAGALSGIASPAARGQISASTSTDVARDLSAAFRQAVQRVEPSVVTIVVGYAGDPAGAASTPGIVGADGRPRVGAGAVIDSSGIVVTSARLMQNATSARVRTADGRTYDARSLRSDAASDLAVVKIDPPSPLPFARFGDSRAVQRGDWAIAVGGGTGDVPSFSTGVVGTFVARSPDLGGAYAIQHDADTDWSHAGGPLVNLAGEVIGFNLAPTMTPAGSAASFAYPVTESRPILRSLIEGRSAARAYLGLLVTNLTANDVTRLAATGVQGALVENVVAGGPAEALGLSRDDILLSFDGRPVVSAQDLQSLLEQRRPGDKVLLTIWRAGRRYEGQTTLIDAANRP